MNFYKSNTLEKFNLFFVMIFTLILTNSCNYVKNVKLLTGGSLDRSDFVETIPFEYKKDLIVLEAQINDRGEKKQFILDTGAFDSKIELGLADQMNLPTKATKSVTTAQGITESIDITLLEKVTLGETAFTKISAGKLQYDSGSASRCIAPHGIIGANLMKLAHWKIDYQHQEIQFSDQPFELSGNNTFTLAFDKPLLSGIPEIEIEVGGRKVSGVLFDLGYNGSLVLPARLSDSFPSEYEKTYYDRSTSGIFGSNTDTLISKKLDVSLGGYVMQIPVEFSSLGKALLGNGILEHFTVTIDYNNNKITLSPETDVQVDSPNSFIPGILNDSLWVVNRTTADLPFTLGDTLSFINNKKPIDLYSSFCDYFLNINNLMSSDSFQIIRVDGSSINILPMN